MHNVAKSFNMLGFDLKDDPLQIIKYEKYF